MLVVIAISTIAIVAFICWIAWEMHNAPIIPDKSSDMKQEDQDDDFLSFMIIAAVCCSD